MRISISKRQSHNDQNYIRNVLTRERKYVLGMLRICNYWQIYLIIKIDNLKKNSFAQVPRYLFYSTYVIK